MAIGDEVIIGWLAGQTIITLIGLAKNQVDIAWIKNTVDKILENNKEKGKSTNCKEEKHAAHEAAADVKDAELLLQLKNLNQKFEEHIVECRELRRRKGG